MIRAASLVFWRHPLRFQFADHPDHNGIHDVIFRCANPLRTATVCPACTCPGHRGKDTCDGTNRLQSTVNHLGIFRDDEADGQNVYRRPSGSLWFLKIKNKIDCCVLVFVTSNSDSLTFLRQ